MKLIVLNHAMIFIAAIIMLSLIANAQDTAKITLSDEEYAKIKNGDMAYIHQNPEAFNQWVKDDLRNPDININLKGMSSVTFDAKSRTIKNKGVEINLNSFFRPGKSELATISEQRLTGEGSVAPHTIIATETGFLIDNIPIEWGGVRIGVKTEQVSAPTGSAFESTTRDVVTVSGGPENLVSIDGKQYKSLSKDRGFEMAIATDASGYTTKIQTEGAVLLPQSDLGTGTNKQTVYFGKELYTPEGVGGLYEKSKIVALRKGFGAYPEMAINPDRSIIAKNGGAVQWGNSIIQSPFNGELQIGKEGAPGKTWLKMTDTPDTITFTGQTNGKRIYIGGLSSEGQFSLRFGPDAGVDLIGRLPSSGYAYHIDGQNYEINNGLVSMRGGPTLTEAKKPEGFMGVAGKFLGLPAKLMGYIFKDNKAISEAQK